jgi:hypothetical protein
MLLMLQSLGKKDKVFLHDKPVYPYPRASSQKYAKDYFSK